MAENQDVVVPKLRLLRYSDNDPATAREKGIDVLLAIDAVEWTLSGLCDVAIVFSHDTDLVPAVEAVIRLGGAAAVETVSWVSPTFNSRLRPRPTVYHHFVDSAWFAQVERRVNYAHEA